MGIWREERLEKIMANFEKLVDQNRYQVFLFSCPGNIPFNFFRHHWFVLNKKGIVSRWEVLFRNSRNKTSWGHLYLNHFPPFQGIEIFPYFEKLLWKGKLIGQVEGEIAEKMIGFIEKSPESYPFCNEYFLHGPNSNTYTQWILNSFPEFKAKLSWNSVGKNWKK